MVEYELLKQHIDEFLELKSSYSKLSFYEEIDTYGFKCNFKDGQTDVMIFALTHGDEIVGLPIINKILKSLYDSKKYNFAVMLNNIEAYSKQSRFKDFDLNRSFGKTLSNIRNDAYEFNRAQQIKTAIIKTNPAYIIDLHQTIEDSVAAFAVIPEQKNLIQMANYISSDTPILSFKQSGFSKIGMTLIEYANSINIPAIVFEVGQKGFNPSLTREFENKLVKFIENISLNHSFLSDKPIDYYLIVEEIPHEPDQSLIAGFKSFQKLALNQQITLNTANKPSEVFINKYENSVIIFPRYSQVKVDEELGLIAEKQTLRE